MQALISLITAFITLISVTLSSAVIPQPQAEDFVPVLRFMACSDTHISGKDDPCRERITKAVNFCYDAAAQSPYTALDAVLFAGDLTDSGTPEQFEAFEETTKAAVKGNTQILAVVAKAHDSYQSKAQAIGSVEQITGNNSDFHVVINGFHFIGLSTSNQEDKNYIQSQRDWLNKQLKAASAADPKKPIFLMHHEHVMDTVYGSKTNVDGWGNTYFKDIIKRYSQVVDFSGHSHYPLNDPRSLWQGTFTAIGTGSMRYMEFTVDGQNNIHTDDGGENPQAWLIEVDANNRLRLRGFDVMHRAWLCDYVIETNKANRSAFAYTQKNQEALSAAPAFDAGAALTVKAAEGNQITVTAPAAHATDGKPVFLYRVAVTDEKGKTVYEGYRLNNYWTVAQYETVTFTVEPSKGSTVAVTAENCYGMVSEALTYAVK